MAIFSVRSGSFGEHMLRLAGLLVLLALVVVGFWKNSERNIERINARFGLSDETKTLSKVEQEQVQAFISALRKSYGIEARVQVSQGPVAPPEQDGKTLFLGLCLDEKSAVVMLPPLVERALGADFARSLAAEHFPFHFGPGKSWQKGLILALDLIQARLAALAAQDASPHKTPAHTNATQPITQ
jgi:hypothetical protein